MILVKPTIACNFKCDYCYQSDIKCKETKIDLEKIKLEMIKNLKGSKRGPTFHGGEITTIPVGQFEELARCAHALCGGSQMQTNGFAISDAHIKIFKKFNVSVGVSIDGPIEVNAHRGVGTKEDREKQYAQVMENIRKMRNENIRVSIISVINDKHMGKENIELFKKWIVELFDMGVCHGRMNLRDQVEGYTVEQASEFYKELADFVLNNKLLMWSPFREMVDNLLGLSISSCKFVKCDLSATQSAIVIHGDGKISSCLRNSLDGEVPERQKKNLDTIRDNILSQTPQEYGGCRGCRYYKVCYGGCPANGINGDWKNRDIHCTVIKNLYSHIEKKMIGILPNLNICLDLQEEIYDERRRGMIGDHPFAKMLPQYAVAPSSFHWRGYKENSSDLPSNKAQQAPGVYMLGADTKIDTSNWERVPQKEGQ